MLITHVDEDPGRTRQGYRRDLALLLPRVLQQMRWNFSGAIQDINPELRKKLEETITGQPAWDLPGAPAHAPAGEFYPREEPLAKCWRLLDDGGSPVCFRRC